MKNKTITAITAVALIAICWAGTVSAQEFSPVVSQSGIRSLQVGQPWDGGRQDLLSLRSSAPDAGKQGAAGKSSSKAASGKAPKISGLFRIYWQYDMVESGEDQNNFKVSNGRLAVKGNLNPISGYKVHVDFTRDGGDILLDALLFIKPTPWSEITAGQFKTTYGTLNLRSSGKQRFISKPLMTSTTSPSTRDVGIAFSGSYEDYSASIGVFNGAGQNEADPNAAKNLAGRVVWKPIETLNLAANTYYGKTNDVDSVAEDLMMYNGSFGFIYENLSIEGEYGHYDTDSKTRSGFFVDAIYDVTLEGILKSVTPGFRYGWYDPDNDASDDTRTRATAGLKFIFARLPNMHFRWNYHYNDLEEGNADNRFLAEVQLKF